MKTYQEYITEATAIDIKIGTVYWERKGAMGAEQVKNIKGMRFFKPMEKINSNTYIGMMVIGDVVNGTMQYSQPTKEKVKFSNYVSDWEIALSVDDGRWIVAGTPTIPKVLR
jgi:hypothetical protein